MRGFGAIWEEIPPVKSWIRGLEDQFRGKELRNENLDVEEWETGDWASEQST